VNTATTERDLLFDRVTAIVRKAAKVPAGVTITPELRLVEDLTIDSLDLVSLILEFQDQFDVVIEEEAVPNLRRVGDIVEYLGRLGMVRNGGPYGTAGRGRRS
jgi:acyl carrier protein